MAATEPRRSQRLGTYDSNGRDYLASVLGWTRMTFEEWVYSSTVRPHLQHWYALCIAKSKRCNDGIEWINTGPEGYFYNEDDLERDTLLMCLCAGDDGKLEDDGRKSSISFTSTATKTATWLTQELWARTAWRIAQDNRSSGQIFHFAMQDRPAAAYGFVIEMLCIIFHSIAFRGSESVYYPLVSGGKVQEVVVVDEAATGKPAPAHNPDLSMQDDDSYTSGSSSNDADRTSDATFVEPKIHQRAESERSTIIIADAAETRMKEIDDKAGDVGSEIMVTRRKVLRSSTRSSASEVQSSVTTPNQQEPATPETNLSWHNATVAEDAGKDEYVQRWLNGVDVEMRL